MVTRPGRTEYLEVDASGFTFTEASYAPNSERPWHVHHQAEFCFMFEGSFTETVGHRRLTCRRFDVTFKPAGETHWTRSGPAGARYLAVGVPAARLGADTRLARVLSSPMFFANSPLTGLGLRICHELQQQDELAPLAMEGAALELLVRALRSNQAPVRSHRPPWLDRVKDLLHDSFTTPLNLGQIAATVGVHPSHLTEVFRRELGCPIGDYVRMLRVNYAGQLMATSDRSLADVALAAGFSDQSHFTRLFKQLTGVTPAAYRRGR
jgi:AraC family transcriptional regulator